MTLSYQHILVPLDGSKLAAAALVHAEYIAKLVQATIILVQVLPSTAMLVSETSVSSPNIGMPSVDPFLSTAQFDSVEDSLVQDAARNLTEAAAPLRAASLQVQTMIIKGDPADAILTYASQEKVDLIVMATHGRTGLSRLVYGSVAESVLHHSQCPVLLVRVISES